MTTDVVTYCRSGVSILNGGVSMGANQLGTRQTIAPFLGSGIRDKTADQTYDILETGLMYRFDDPRYYAGDTAL